jgi:hypothetical protein
LLGVLGFPSSDTTHRPVIEALELITQQYGQMIKYAAAIRPVPHLPRASSSAATVTAAAGGDVKAVAAAAEEEEARHARKL